MTRREVRAHTSSYLKTARAAMVASEARRAQPIGTSRARVTTANARLFWALENRTRERDELRELGLGAICDAVDALVNAEAAAELRERDA